MKPRLFLSTVTSELKTTRQLGANILARLGYEPVWQDLFGTESGDVKKMLREKIDGCDGLIHVVGHAYGAEPPRPDSEFGRVSYTQYEFCYARRTGKKTWVIFVEESFPADKAIERLDLPLAPGFPDPASYQAERRALQVAWRQKLRRESHLRHSAATTMEFELRLERLKDELRVLRRSFWRWQMTVLLALAALVGLAAGIWATVFRHRDEQKIEVEEVKGAVRTQAEELKDVVKTQAELIRLELAMLRPQDIKGQLLKTIEETYRKELVEAEGLTDWKEREEARKGAKDVRETRLDKVDEFVDSITGTIKSGAASPEFLEFIRIFRDQGAAEALNYIDAQEHRLLAEADKLTREKRKKLAPLLEAIRIHFNRGEYPAARDKCEKLLRQDGDWSEALEEHIRVLWVIGDRGIKYDSTAAAAAAYRTMEKSARRRADADPKNAGAQRDLSVSFIKLGDVTLQQGQTQESLDFYRKSLDVRQKLADADPKNAGAQRDLFASFNNLGEVTLQLGQTLEARAFYRKSLDMAQKLADADPNNAQAQRDLSLSIGALGDVTLKLGQTQMALDFYRKNLDIAQKLADADPNNAQAQRDLFISLNQLGVATLKLDQNQKALDFYRKSLDIAQKLADADPKNPKAQRDLLISFSKFGDISQSLKDYSAAIKWYEKALAVAETFDKPEIFKAEVAALKKGIAICKEQSPTK